MNNSLLKKLIWNYKQPLTKQPDYPGMPVSDLFVWKESSLWNTTFELFDVSTLFIDSNKKRSAQLICFDNNGIKLSLNTIELVPNKRCRLALSDYLPDAHGEMGTFCVFHSETPDQINELGSFITERGYISYRYKNMALQSYVHGNYDAVSLADTNELQYLGGRSLLTRQYRVQYEFNNNDDFELVFVNPSASPINIKCKTINCMDLSESELISSPKMNPGGVVSIKLNNIRFKRYRVIAYSKLVMPRPVVIRMLHDSLDVFHG